jgi:hypothetical protein
MDMYLRRVQATDPASLAVGSSKNEVIGKTGTSLDCSGRAGLSNVLEN